MDFSIGSFRLTTRSNIIARHADYIAQWLNYADYNDMEAQKLRRIEVSIRALSIRKRTNMLANLFGFGSFGQLYRYEKRIHERRMSHATQKR